MPADSVLRCCPQCGSSAVDFSALVGGTATCAGCGWEGREPELLMVPAVGADEQQNLVGLMADLRLMMSRDVGTPLLKFLIKWGFCEADPNNIAGTLDRRVFSQYLAAIAAAVLQATLETRRALAITPKEKEQHDREQN